MIRRLLAVIACALAGGAIGCTEGASNDPAVGALMRIEGAQFVPGASPVASGDVQGPDVQGPDVEALDLLTNSIWPGYADKPIRGSLGALATAATLAFSGDQGYWIVAAGVPDVAAPGLPSFRATAAFSTALVPGAYALEVRAADAAGHLGAPLRQTLTALSSAPSLLVAGALVVSLEWDTEADLDLHVVDASGDEIFHGAPRGASRSGAEQPDPGTLDVDSNANCTIDGLRREHVIWRAEPPAGHYVVRVDAASLCGRASAHWRVDATLDGVVLAASTGLALDIDSAGPHDRGAGVLALEFDVP
jgi:hypothetical protein